MAGALLVPALSGFAGEDGVLARDGDRLSTERTSGDTDDFDIDLSEGGSLSVKLTADRRSSLVPEMTLFRPDGVEADIADFLKKSGTQKPQLKRFTPASGETGRWTLRVGGVGEGAYTIQIGVAAPTSSKTKGLVVPAGGTARVEVTADDAALLTARVKRKDGPDLTGARLLRPDGSLLPDSGQAFTAKGKSLSVKKLPLAGGFGRYVLELTGAADADTVVDVTTKVKAAKIRRRKETLPPEGRLTRASRSVVKQQDSALVIDLAGSDILPGSTVAFEGEGITVRGVEITSPSSIRATIDVASDAPYGPRGVSVRPPPLLGEVFRLREAFDVHAPDPAVAFFSPSTLRQGDLNVAVNVLGTAFRDGGALSVSGAGVTVGATSVLSASMVRVELSTAIDAPTTSRTVTWRQPEEGGGASTTAFLPLAVANPTPVLTSLEPARLGRGDVAVIVTLRGDHFREGGSVTMGDGVTVEGGTFANAGRFRVSVTVDEDATLGMRDVTYTQPASGGGAATTFADGLLIEAPAPTITSVTPTSMTRGEGPTLVTVTGADFENGGVISIEGVDLTVGATEFIDGTTVRAPATVNSGAAFGARLVSFTQPTSLGGAVGFGGSLAVHAHAPTVTAISPNQLDQRTSGTVTVTGTNFTTQGALSTSAAGVTFSNLTYLSETQVRADFDVPSDAPSGLHDVQFTQSSAAGSGTATLVDGLEILDTRVLVTSISPEDWLTGAAHFRVTVIGEHFNTGTAVSASGTGVTIHSVTVVSSTQLTLDVSVASTAALSGRDLTITPGPDGPDPRTFTNAITTVPADPTVVSFSHVALARGASSVAVTITGTNFRTGDALSASGTGVTFASVSIVSPERVTALATVTSGATLGARDLTISHATSAGGRSDTLADGVEIISATPTITSASPSSIGRAGSGGATQTLPVRVTGTGFMTGAALSVSKLTGSGLSVVNGSELVVSSTLLTATLSIAGTATPGLWDAKVSNPSALGDSGASGNGAIDVKTASTLVVNSATPSPGAAFGDEVVTIRGGGFTSGAIVDFGTVRASGVHVLDSHTLLVRVPAPTSPSRTLETRVNVKVTLASGSNATLLGGYAYAADTGSFRVVTSYPAPDATGVTRSLVRAGLLLSAPIDTATATYDGSAGTGPSSTGLRWFEVNGSGVTGGSIAFGPNGRWIVFKRNAGSLTSSGSYALGATSAVRSTSSNPLRPVVEDSSTVEQIAFDVHASATDTTAPTLSSISPVSAATGVAPSSVVTLTFSEAVDPSTLAANVQLELGNGTIVASRVDVSDDWDTVTLTPDTELATSTAHTVRVKSGLLDASGNAIVALTRTFTTGTGVDTTAPTIVDVQVADLRSDMDGSGTYVNATGVNTAFDSYLGRSGWRVVVTFADEGGAGIDPSTFSAKASVAVGTAAANAELAAQFVVTHTQASWRVPATFQFTAGENVTLTFLVKDRAATPNTSTSTVITFDVVDKDTLAAATVGGDHDPMDARRTWLLRGDSDNYTATFHELADNVVTPADERDRGVTTTLGGNGIRDVQEALELVGLNSGSMTTAAAATVSGTNRGTNDIAYTLFMRSHRAAVRERFRIDADGTRDASSPDIEFLIEGEQGSLSSPPLWSTTNAQTSTRPFSEMTLGGTAGADTSQFGLSNSVLGQAWLDPRNRVEVANINDGTNNATGVYMIHYLDFELPSTGRLRTEVADRFLTLWGGTPLGEHASDDDVLAGTFDRTTSTNTTHNARYDDIMDGIDFVALLVSSTTAHEVGHSIGLVAVGAPKTGLFGGAHENNTFTEATSISPNTSAHLNVIGPEVMAAVADPTADTATGSALARFNRMIQAWMLGRLMHDEGK